MIFNMKWSFSQKGLLYAALAITLVGIFFVIVAPRSHTPARETTMEQQHLSTLTAASTTIAVMLAETPEEHARGLSGREGLDADMGMLFIFDHSEQYGFWMPDMHFPIDIIWIGEDWRIVDIMPRTTPESYPTVFKPRVPARYVLEVNAGNTAAWGWDVGTQFVFSR